MHIDIGAWRVKSFKDKRLFKEANPDNNQLSVVYNPARCMQMAISHLAHFVIQIRCLLWKFVYVNFLIWISLSMAERL